VRAAFAAILLLAGAANADVVSEKPDSVVVAIYHEGAVDTRELMNGDGMEGAFGFIVESRTIELPAGPSLIRFRDVASTIVPESAQIDGLPQGSLERNFDYDLLSPGTLVERSVGREVHLVRTDPATGREADIPATVRAASDGAVLDIGGNFEAPSCGGPPERIVFDSIPDGLTESPTLSVRAFVPEAGTYTVRLSYIAMNMNWSADYVARISPDGDTLALTGWITLANLSDTSFRDTPAEVIGGNPHTTGDDHAVEPIRDSRAAQCWPLAVRWFEQDKAPVMDKLLGSPVETVVVTGSRVPQEGLYSSSPMTATVHDFGDYKLYTLPVRTDVAARQTKQVAFLDQHDVKFERIYAYTLQVEWDHRDIAGPQPAKVRYRMQNREDAGLGKPLPGGTVSIVDSGTNGAPVFVGQSAIVDTPEGLPVNIDTGDALAVRVEPKIVATETIGSGRDERKRNTIEVSIANAKTIPARFELSQNMDVVGARVVAEDRPHVIEEGNIRWKLTLAPGEQTTLHYTFEYASNPD
jgi:hypothetical protein